MDPAGKFYPINDTKKTEHLQTVSLYERKLNIKAKTKILNNILKINYFLNYFGNL